MDSSHTPPDAAAAALNPYTYCLLGPRVGVAGDNLPLLDASSLGIEVTVPGLARRRGLGNIEPQHGGGRHRSRSDGDAPASGGGHVAVRPDPDAIGPMALLTLRRAGQSPGPAMREKIAGIARANRFDHLARPPVPCELLPTNSRPPLARTPPSLG